MKRPFLQSQLATSRRFEAMTVKPTRLHGRTQVLGTGEITFDVIFPIKFIEKPQFSVGAELDKNSMATTGSFPWANACIIDWATEGASLSHEGLYVGATLAVLVGGNSGQTIWVHWSFDASAIRNPVAVIENVDDVL